MHKKPAAFTAFLGLTLLALPQCMQRAYYVDPAQAQSDGFEEPLELYEGRPLGSLGLNLERYFEPEIHDPIVRVKRLERAVIAMHRDQTTMALALQDMAGPLPRGKMVTAEAPTKPVNIMPKTQQAKPEPVTAEPAKKAAPVVSGAPAVVNVRVGEHKDKIRVVFDMTAKTAYRADLDNAEKLLVVEFPEAGWNAANTQSFAKMPLLRSYKTEAMDNGKGHMAIFQLEKPTSIIAQEDIPGAGKSARRIFIDLKR